MKRANLRNLEHELQATKEELENLNENMKDWREASEEALNSQRRLTFAIIAFIVIQMLFEL